MKHLLKMNDLTREELSDVELALAHYLGLTALRPPG